MGRKPLKAGIVGAGVILKQHVTSYHWASDLAQLVAVADLDASRADNARRRFGLDDSYGSHQELLARDDIDVISVCVPARYHAEIVLDAIRAGKHVLCEKPLSPKLSEVDAIVEAAAARPELKVSAVYQFRSERVHRRIRRLIEGEHLGQLTSAALQVLVHRDAAYYSSAPGRGTWEMDGGGVLMNQAVHVIDALLTFMGSPVEVSAQMATLLAPSEAEDLLVGWVRFESGALATIEVNGNAHAELFHVTVQGENASTTVRVDPGLPPPYAWELRSHSEASQQSLRALGMELSADPPANPSASQVFAERVRCRLRRREYHPAAHLGHSPFVREFLQAIHDDEAVPVSPLEARRSVELSTALYASALAGGAPVTLPIGSDHPCYDGVRPERSGPRAIESDVA